MFNLDHVHFLLRTSLEAFTIKVSHKIKSIQLHSKGKMTVCDIEHHISLFTFVFILFLLALQEEQVGSVYFVVLAFFTEPAT